MLGFFKQKEKHFHDTIIFKNRKFSINKENKF